MVFIHTRSADDQLNFERYGSVQPPLSGNHFSGMVSSLLITDASILLRIVYASQQTSKRLQLQCTVPSRE
eukprot:scaffold658911_cov32-Prasinocladus_malaysianus.AAC.1